MVEARSHLRSVAQEPAIPAAGGERSDHLSVSRSPWPSSGSAGEADPPRGPTPPGPIGARPSPPAAEAARSPPAPRHRCLTRRRDRLVQPCGVSTARWPHDQRRARSVCPDARGSPGGSPRT
jgi:hypothetical protein